MIVEYALSNILQWKQKKKYCVCLCACENIVSPKGNRKLLPPRLADLQALPAVHWQECLEK